MGCSTMSKYYDKNKLPKGDIHITYNYNGYGKDYRYLQQRIDKAIKYIVRRKINLIDLEKLKMLNELLSILKGSEE